MVSKRNPKQLASNTLFIIVILIFLSPYTIAEETFEQSAIKNNIAISRWLDEMAEEIDLFIVGKKITDRKNETTVKLDNTTYIEERKKSNNTTGLNVNLQLPNLEGYWQLKFSSYDESEQKRGIQKGPLRKTPQQRNYGASLGVIRALGKINTSFTPRLNFGSPIKITHSLSFDTTIDNTTYQLHPKLEFYANHDKGTGIYNAFNINIPLSKYYALSFINSSEYEDKIHTYTVTNGFSVGQSLNEKTSLAYSLIFTSNNRERYHMEDYTYAITWSQVLYKRILDYQVTPYLVFPRTKGYNAVPGLIVAVSLIF